MVMLHPRFSWVWTIVSWEPAVLTGIFTAMGNRPKGAIVTLSPTTIRFLAIKSENPAP